MRKVKVLAMAYERKEVRRYIRNKAESLAKHVCLVLMYPSDDSTDHWIVEIAALLKYIHLHRLVKKAGPLPREEVMELLFGEPLDHEMQVTLTENYNIHHMDNKEPERKLSVQLLGTVYSKLCDLICDVEVIIPSKVEPIFEGV